MRHPGAHVAIPLALVFVLGFGCDRNAPSSSDLTDDHVPLDAPTERSGAPGDPEAPASLPIKGEVTEALDVARYTYIKIDTEEGDRWVAATKLHVETGETVEVSDYQVMRDFHSKSLNKTFPEIIFAARVVVMGEDGQPRREAPPADGTMPPGHPAVGPAAGSDTPPGHPPMGSDERPQLPPGHPSLDDQPAEL